MSSQAVRARLLVLLLVLVTLIGAAAAVAVHRLYGAAATIDTVYRDRVLCMEQLRLVREAYVVRMAGDVTRVRDGLLDGRQALSDLDDARQQIATQWSAYKGTYLVDRERGLIAKAEPLLRRADDVALRLRSALGSNDQTAL